MAKCKRCGRALKDPSKDLGPVCERKMEEAHADMLLKWQQKEGEL